MTNIPTLVASMALGLAFTIPASAQVEDQANETTAAETIEQPAEAGATESAPPADLQPGNEAEPADGDWNLTDAVESRINEDFTPDRGEFVRDEEGFLPPDQFAPAEMSIEPANSTPPSQPQSRNPFSRRDSRVPAPAAPQQVRMSFGPPSDEPMPATGDDQIRLNFRGVPLEMVLNYLSEAAGFIIVPKVDIKGSVDVWSNQPLTKDEVVEVLNTQLKDNNYAAIRNGRILTIVSREQAGKTGPVISGNIPSDIPKTDEIVTQIIPVRYINAAALTANLQPLLPSQATLTANEAGNALILTDTQSNIRRMVEIIAALDTSVASISTVRVFPLTYADAKELATIVTSVFETPSQNNNQGGRNRMENFFRGGGRGGGEDTAANAGGRAGAARVTAVADERSNSLVISAPTELIPTIEELVASVDTNIDDITDLRVFHLTHADPVETAELLTSLFQDETQNNNNNRNVRFGRGRPNNNAATETSDRLKKQTRVVAVADQRTGSVVVSAARAMMPQIEEMVAQLDSDPARKQKVFVYDVQNSDPQAVLQTLEGLFESPTGRNTRNTRNNNNALGGQLNTRATQQQNQRNTQNNLGGGNFGAGNTGR